MILYGSGRWYRAVDAPLLQSPLLASPSDASPSDSGDADDEEDEYDDCVVGDVSRFPETSSTTVVHSWRGVGGNRAMNAGLDAFSLAALFL